MEQENERRSKDPYSRRIGILEENTGRRDTMSSEGQQRQQQQYQEETQQEQNHLQEFTSPLVDHEEESAPQSQLPQSPIEEGVSDRRQAEEYSSFSPVSSPSRDEISNNNYQAGAGGSEMSSFLGNYQQRGQESVPSSSRSGIEETTSLGGSSTYTGNAEEETSQFSSQQQQQQQRRHRHHKKHHNSGDISDRELISKLLDMLRDKEHAKDVAQTESHLNYQQHNHDSAYLMPGQNSFGSSYTAEQEQQQQEFRGTGRSSFPQEPDYQNSMVQGPAAPVNMDGPPQIQSQLLQQQESPPPAPQAQNILSSLIQNLERSNSVPYAPPMPDEQQSFYQKPSLQSFLQQQPQPSEPGFDSMFNQHVTDSFAQFQPPNQGFMGGNCESTMI